MIETENRDLSTKDGWEGYLQWERDTVAKNYADREIAIADCSLVVTHDPITEQPFERPSIFVCATIFTGATDKEIEASKVTWNMLVRSMAITGRAIASVFISEAWQSIRDSKATAPVVPPRDDPNRQEVIIMNCDHRTLGGCSYTARISHIDGKRQIGPWDDHGQLMGGRMASFLPPIRALDDKTAQWAARMFIQIQREKQNFEEVFRQTPGRPS